MPETKRYDVSGKPRGGGRTYPDGTILKLTEDQAKTMGLSSSDVSSVTTTADDARKADRYEEALTHARTLRDDEVERANATPADADADADAGNKARRTRR